jgi:hypothetical protein
MSKISLTGNPSGTGTLTIAAPNTNTDRTLTLPDNTGTVITTGSTFAGTGPAFSASQTSGQSLSGGAWTKITASVEEYDTASCYNTSTYRFTPNVAGYYSVFAGIGISGGITYLYCSIYKNGASYKSAGSGQTAGTSGGINCIVYLNGSTDYIELYGLPSSTVNTNGSGAQTYFQAALVRAA